MFQASNIVFVIVIMHWKRNLYSIFVRFFCSDTIFRLLFIFSVALKWCEDAGEYKYTYKIQARQAVCERKFFVSILRKNQEFGDTSPNSNFQMGNIVLILQTEHTNNQERKRNISRFVRFSFLFGIQPKMVFWLCSFYLIYAISIQNILYL